MVKVIYDSVLFSNGSDRSEDLRIAISEIESVAESGFEFEDAISALDGEQLIAGDPIISADALTWFSHPPIDGDSVVVRLTGPVVPTEAEIGAFETAEEGVLSSISSLDLNELSISIGEETVLKLVINSDSIAITSGGQEITLDLELGTTDVDLLEVVQVVSDLGQLSQMEDAARADAIAAADELNVTGLHISSDGFDLASFDLTGPAPAVLNVGTFAVTLNGTDGPMGLGSLAGDLELFNVSNPDAAALAGAGYTDLTLTDLDDAALITVDFAGERETVIRQSEPGYDFNINSFGHTLLSTSEISGVGDAPQQLTIELHESNSGVNLEMAALQAIVGEGKTFETLHIVGGEDSYDGLYLDTGSLQIENADTYIFDHDAYFDALFDPDLNPHRSVILEDDYNTAVENHDFDSGEPFPEREDFLNPEVVDVDALAADLVAFNAAVVERFGEVITTYPDPYTDTYFIGPESGGDRYSFWPWDDFQYNEDLNEWYSAGGSESGLPEPVLYDYPLNTDKFAHGVLETHTEIALAYNINKPSPYDSKYLLPDTNVPVLTDYLLDDNSVFDFESFSEDLAQFYMDNPEAESALANGYPNSDAFRTSFFDDDYWLPEGFADPFNYDEFAHAIDAYNELSDEERDSTPRPEFYDFPNMDGLYDTDGLRTAIIAYETLQSERPNPFDYLDGPKVIVNFESGEISTEFDGETTLFGTFEDINSIGHGEGSDVQIIGADGDERFGPNRLGSNDIEIDGGDGEGDFLDLRFVDRDDLDDARGVTIDEFSALFALVAQEDGSVHLTAKDSGDVLARLSNVELIELWTSDDRDEGAKYSLSQLLNPVADGEPIVGTILDDVLVGSANEDTINGLEGEDTIRGLGGDDSIDGGLGEDRIYGGEGNDTIIVGENDNVRGDAGDDLFDLSAQTFGWGSFVRPGLGNNTLNGSETLFESGEGHDLSYQDLSGVGGLTIVVGENGTGTTVSGIAGQVNDTFSYFHRFEGSMDADKVSGSANPNWEGFAGLAGDDTIDGGEGHDEILYHQSFYHTDKLQAVDVNFDTGIASDAFGNTDTLSNIEGVRGTSLDDKFTGSDKQSYSQFRGLAGNDMIIGALLSYDIADYSRDEDYGGAFGIIADLGAGTVRDGFGDNDTVSNIDQVRGTNLADIMTAGDVAVKFVGRFGDDTMTGGIGDDHFVGGGSNNMIDGKEGDDIVEILANRAEVMMEVDGAAVILSGVGDNGIFVDTVENVEYFQFKDETVSLGQLTSGTSETDDALDLSGSTDDEMVDAGSGDDTVTTGSGDDEIFTGEGDDSVSAGGGDDLIVDLAGDDTINGGEGDDVGGSLSGNNTFGEAADTGSVAADRSINDFYFAGFGDDAFASGGGNDLLIADIGSAVFAGKDTLDGGSGDDVMQAGLNADVFVFDDNHGNDTIATIDLVTLPDNLSTIDIDSVPLILAQADFQVGIDKIDLSAMAGISDLADLTITNGANGAIIDTGSGTITLVDILASDLTSDSFIF